jgi:Tat protein secretion system quality control protein TatD with DNase activity
MLLALDYDDTYTRDKEFWNKFIDLSTSHGHTVICVTMRHDKPHSADIVREELGHRVEKIIFTAHKAKMKAVADAGYYVSVWIDDSPNWILKDAFLGR